MSNKLKCLKHNRRVMVLQRTVIHRQDGSDCSTLMVHIFGRQIPVDTVRKDKMVRP